LGHHLEFRGPFNNRTLLHFQAILSHAVAGDACVGDAHGLRAHDLPWF
jgi:hypothetical protein